jgi:hypothetical protein
MPTPVLLLYYGTRHDSCTQRSAMTGSAIITSPQAMLSRHAAQGKHSNCGAKTAWQQLYLASRRRRAGTRDAHSTGISMSTQLAVSCHVEQEQQCQHGRNITVAVVPGMLVHKQASSPQSWHTAFNSVTTE